MEVAWADSSAKSDDGDCSAAPRFTTSSDNPGQHLEVIGVQSYALGERFSIIHIPNRLLDLTLPMTRLLIVTFGHLDDEISLNSEDEREEMVVPVRRLSTISRMATYNRIRHSSFRVDI